MKKDTIVKTELKKISDKIIERDNIANTRFLYLDKKSKIYKTSASIVREYLENIDEKTLKKFISSNELKNIPFYSCKRVSIVPNDFLISLIFSYLSKLNKGRKLLISHSEGVLACLIFDKASSKERLYMSKRLFKNLNKLDARLKKRIINYIGVKNLRKMYEVENNKDVLRAIDKRFHLLGIVPPCKLTPYDYISSLELNELDALSYFRRENYSKLISFDFTSEQANVTVAKLKAMIELISLDDLNGIRYKLFIAADMIMHLLKLCNKDVFIMNMDIPQIEAFKIGNWRGENFQEIFSFAMTSKWC